MSDKNKQFLPKTQFPEKQHFRVKKSSRVNFHFSSPDNTKCSNVKKLLNVSYNLDPPMC